MKVQDLLGWLHENPFYPNRRRQALWFIFNNLQGEQLNTFARYAKSISYAFSQDDLNLLNRIIQKAQGKSAPPSTRQNGIGDFFSDMAAAEAAAANDPDLHGQDGMIPGLGMSDPDLDPNMGGGLPGMWLGEEMPSGQPGGGGYLGNVLAGVVSGLVSGARGTTGTTQIPVGTRNAQNPNYVWSGTGWIYSPVTTTTTTTGVTAAAPSAAQTQAWLAAGQLKIGSKTTTGWTWNGSTWIPTSQVGTTPSYVPTTVPTTTTATGDNTLLIATILVGGLLLLGSRRRGG